MDIDAFIAAMPAPQAALTRELRALALAHMPTGFAEEIAYGMVSYVVPHALYPAGYHCNPRQPLPLVSIGVKKSGITLHHMGLYASAPLKQWFETAYAKLGLGKLDMGKGCVRFAKPDLLPRALLGELFGKLTPQAWIREYEAMRGVAPATPEDVTGTAASKRTAAGARKPTMPKVRQTSGTSATRSVAKATRVAAKATRVAAKPSRVAAKATRDAALRAGSKIAGKKRAHARGKRA